MVRLEVYDRRGALVEETVYEDMMSLEMACWQRKLTVFERSGDVVRAREG